MYVSIPLVALVVSMAVAVTGLVSWIAYRMVRKERVITETVPQLSGAVFGPPDATGRPQHRKGLEGKYDDLDRRIKTLQQQLQHVQQQIQLQLQQIQQQQIQQLQQQDFEASASATGPHRAIVVVERPILTPAPIRSPVSQDLENSDGNEDGNSDPPKGR